MWWKRFTDWDIGSILKFSKKKTTEPQPNALTRSSTAPFRSLAWRLLFSYLVAMSIVLGVSIIAIYQSVAYSLFQRRDQQLVTLADAAAHNLAAILNDRIALYTKSPRMIDEDEDLDIPWQDLRQDQQSIEWFDSRRRLLGRSGQHFPDHSPGVRFQTWQQEQIRSLTIPVYAIDPTAKRLIGYVRVNDSTQNEQEELNRLLAGMGWGGLIAVILIGITGWQLTRRSLRPIEQSFQQLKQFTADASHELRSPLTAIKTSVEVLQSHPERIHPADVRKIDHIADATQQMTQLVEDLLLLARTDAAQIVIKPLRIPLNELLEDLVEALQSQAMAKQITLTIAPLPELQVEGDAFHLRRLFANLIENALSYTPIGGSVEVLLAERSPSLDYVWIAVKDNGIGIAAAHLPHVFDRFWRANPSRTHRGGGSGLGLAIAQAIAQAHDGEITVTSQVGRGSNFQVRLPLA